MRRFSKALYVGNVNITSSVTTKPNNLAQKVTKLQHQMSSLMSKINRITASQSNLNFGNNDSACTALPKGSNSYGSDGSHAPFRFHSSFEASQGIAIKRSSDSTTDQSSYYDIFST